DPVWPVESVRGSDPLGAGRGGFKDSENCLGIGGGPGTLPCVASRGAVMSSAARRWPVGGFTATLPLQTPFPVAQARGLWREGEMVALPANFDLTGESATVWQDVNGMDFIRRVFLLRKHS